ncbi:MAG: aminoglycoside phosphotransferase family protein [Lactococcus raffinolactis]|uniref:aminoglycoside phosphotransferase family protein n=1 Tax=Pseudolactococcus raffinolactis TaxID=1366 RepID=UPI0039954C2A
MIKQESAKGRKEIIVTPENVIRPIKPWTMDVQRFLAYMTIERQITFVPKPKGIDNNGNEVVSFLAGEVYDYPLPNLLLSDATIDSAAKLLRKYHDLSVDYLSQLTGNEKWMFNIQMPQEVMCHNDFAPYNVTTRNGLATGMIDFDTLCPGTRLWDVVYAAYRWVPFYSEDIKIDFNRKCLRLQRFLQAYGLEKESYPEVISCLMMRLQVLIQFMISSAAKGEENFQNNIRQGHIEKYEADIQYLREHELSILSQIGVI